MKLVLVLVFQSAAIFAISMATMSSSASGHSLYRRVCSKKIDGETLPSADISSKKLPNALIIGAAKAGTTALLQMLAIHPEVAIPEHCEELEFFSNEKRYRRGLNWYQSIMPENSTTKKIVLEKTPEYFFLRHVPRRVHGFNSTIKLILLLRDPVQCAISHYTMVYNERCSFLHPSVPNRCRAQKPRFEEIFPEPDFREWKLVNGPAVKEGYNRMRNHLVRSGLYAQNLRRWLRYFPREQILILDGDQLLANPAPIVRDACEFLGLDSSLISEKVFHFNQTKGKYCWTQPAGEPGQDGHGHGHEQSTCLPPHKGTSYTPVAKNTLKKWARFFAPKNEEFFKLIGRRFPNWGK